MNRDEKAATIERIAGELEEADAVFAVDYRGISVPQAAELRARLRDADASFRVVKNSLTERAADRAGVEALKALLDGPTALTFVRGDAALAAKALSDAARTTRLLDFKGGVMNGGALSAADVQSIARLPSRDVLYGQLVGTIASPLGGLVRTLNALIAGVAIQLQAVVDQGLVGSGAPAVPEPNDPTTAPPEADAAVPADAEPHSPPEPGTAEGAETAPDQQPSASTGAPVVGPDQAEGEDSPPETQTPEED